MTIDDIIFSAETADRDTAIETLNAEAFGPGRFARAACRIREEGPHERALSLVALGEGIVVGSVRLTRIAAGAGRALLLGPLAVAPRFKNIGIGRRLVALSLDKAGDAGAGLVVLVGDEPYYGPLGFARIPPGQLQMPRPVDPRRLLAHELRPGVMAVFKGAVTHADRAFEPQRDHARPADAPVAGMEIPA